MTNLSGRSRENLQLSAAQEERISLSSAVQSGSPYEAQGGLSQASPQAHDQQRELHRKPPRGLSQRIMLALTVLLTGLAALYSAAMVGVIGYTEEELISSFLEDDMDYVVSQIERGDTAIGLPHADVYGDAPGLKPVPAQFQDCPFGFTEITEAPAVFVWRRAWQGGSLMIVRDQEGFEEKEQELFILMLAVLLVVFLVGAAAGKRLAVQVMRPVDKIERSSKMMHELVEGFLAFARLSENAGSDRVSDVLQAVGRLWIPEAAKAGRQLVFRQEDCCPGSFSPLLLSTVVSNLVKNALTYSHEGEIKVTETSTGIVVADHGDPIPPAEQKRIFEPFVRGKASADIEQTGFGLGLSIVWRICMRMGWQVNLASGPDGNAFTVTLVSLADAAEPVRRSDELG